MNKGKEIKTYLEKTYLKENWSLNLKKVETSSSFSHTYTNKGGEVPNWRKTKTKSEK